MNNLCSAKEIQN